jgi:hypothetical protein
MENIPAYKADKYSDTTYWVTDPVFFPDKETILAIHDTQRIWDTGSNYVREKTQAEKDAYNAERLIGSSYEIKIYDYMDDSQHNLDITTPPKDHDWRVEVNVPQTGRFEHSKTLSKGDHGDFSSKTYYSTVTIDTGSNKPILSDVVLKRDFNYEYHHAQRWIKKTETVSWYKKDDTAHDDTKTIVHYFDGQKYMNYMVEKRTEIIEFLKTWVEQSMGYNALYNSSSSLYQNPFSELDTKGKTFLGDFDGSIRKFIDGQPQTETGSFVYNLTHDTGSHHWVNDPVTPTVPNGNPNETIRELMISESLYPMS